MGEKRFARNPLLYIQQPSINTPKAPMQYNYVTPKKSREAAPQEKKSDTVKPRQIKRDNFRIKNSEQAEDEYSRAKEDASFDKVEHDEKETDTADEDDDQEITLGHTEKTTDRPKFKNMTLEEKVEYFVNLPTHVPKMRCEVKTDEKTFRGVITDYKENVVFMRVGRRTSNTKIPIEEIEQIRMLGF